MNTAAMAAGVRACEKMMTAMSEYRLAIMRGDDGEQERRSAQDNLDAYLDHVAALILSEKVIDG
jgi:hypothetical protein